MTHQRASVGNRVVRKFWEVSISLIHQVGLFASDTDTMRSFFAQPDHMGVFRYVMDCLDFMKI